MATTGARIGEVCALNVGDVTKRRVGGVDRWRVRVGRAKGGVGRDLPLSASVANLLDLSRAKTDPLFVTPLGNRVNHHNWRARTWRPACTSAKVSMTPHGLRHTAISWAIADGADIKAVQRMARHKSAAVTLNVYGHLWDQGLDDVADRMGSRIQGVVPTPSD